MSSRKMSGFAGISRSSSSTPNRDGSPFGIPWQRSHFATEVVAFGIRNFLFPKKIDCYMEL